MQEGIDGKAQTGLYETSSMRAHPDRPVRVLHVVGSYFPALVYGGPIYAVHHLCMALSETGRANVEVLTTNIDGNRLLDVPTGVLTAVDGVGVTYCAITIGGNGFSFDHLIRMLRYTKSFDIIHFHSVFTLTTVYGPIISRAEGIPYVITPHGSLVPELIERRGKWKKKAWIAVFDQRTLEKASAVHLTTELEAKYLRATNIHPKSISIIPNGVDPDLFIPLSGGAVENFRHKYSIAPEDRIICFLGRINWMKGLDILIPACRALATDGVPFRLVLAGPDSNGYRTDLEKMVSNERIESRILFTGALVGEEKKACLATSNVIVLPSRSENFGIAAAEGMAMSKPVVVTEGVGIAPDLQKCSGGVVVPFDSVSLFKALRGLLAVPEEGRKMGERGSTWARERYAWPSIADRMLSLYSDILSQEPRRA